MVIIGRSNQRLWLVPLTNSNVTISGMALFQPINASAQVLKNAGVVAATLGLSRLLAQKRIYITGQPTFLADIFEDRDLHYAFFTGTDSPHRKTAVQIMDHTGNIKGYAKVSGNRSVRPLLTHEAETLNYLKTLALETALIPTVLFCGEAGGAGVLVTDTLKTAKTKTSTALTEAHIAFLRELAEKTALPNTDGNDWYITELRRRYDAVAKRVPSEWQRRLEQAIDCVSRFDGQLGPRCLSHGDFTPWNTFFVDGKLYVFDWEYAQLECSAGYDLIHFLLSHPETKKQQVRDTITGMRATLRKMQFAQSDYIADLHLLAYLCGHSLQYIAREPESRAIVDTWDGECEAALLIDTVMGLVA